MTEPVQPTPGRAEEAEFLSKDFEHIAASLLQNEELGDKRLTFFVTLVGAFFGGVGYLIHDLKDEIAFNAHLAIALAAVILLGVGALTLLRVARRNAVTDGYTKILAEMRKQLAPTLSPRYQHLFVKGDRSMRNGGHLYVVALLNAALGGALVWALGNPVTSPGAETAVLALAGVVAVLLFVLQALLVGKPSEQDATFRAGVGLVITNPRGEVLAIERSKNPGAWQLPQGGLHRGEAPLEGAYRELREETGLERSSVICLAENRQWLAYELPGANRSPKTGLGQVHKWFLFRFSGRDSDIVLPAKGEAARWAWKALDDLAETAVEFRRPVYAQLEAWVRQERRDADR